MTPDQHRVQALHLASRAETGDSAPATLAVVAIVHALLATSPVELEPVVGRAERPVTWQGWLVLAMVMGTLLGCVWLVTQ